MEVEIKKNWFRDGDKNTNFFHKMVHVLRRRDFLAKVNSRSVDIPFSLKYLLPCLICVKIKLQGWMTLLWCFSNCVETLLGMK